LDADPLGALVPGGPTDVGAAGEGPLSGITFVAKDVIDVAGTVTGAGNPDWAGSHEPAAADAAAVTALVASGARLVGKGQCAELAFSLSGDNAHFGMPRNPAAPQRDPGGSTSGPAAAVAGGLCELGLGTDTLGSIRVPASYCGLYGYRPTHGAISTDGVLPLAQAFDTVGLLARRPDVLRRCAEVLAGGRATGDGAPPRRLLLVDELLAAAEPQVADAVRAAAERLARALGASLERVPRLPGTAPGLPDALAAFNALQGHEAWRNFGAWVEGARPSLGPDVEARLERAAGIGPARVAEARPVAAAVGDSIRRLGAEAALVLPSTGTPAPPRDAGPDAREAARVGAGQLTCLATLAGAPSVSLPLAAVGGLPVGIGMVGAPGADAALLAAAQLASAGA
jgi:amidase